MDDREAARTRTGERREGEQGRASYDLYGLRIASDIPLLGVPTAAANGTVPGVVIRRGRPEEVPAFIEPPVASIPCPIHGTDMVEYRDSAGTWIRLRSAGTFLVSGDAAHVRVHADDGVDDQTITLALVGPVLLFVRHKQGFPTLHASAVVVRQRAIAFIGTQQSGKSTMAAVFLHRGAALLTDDALPLELSESRVLGYPGLPQMKLWKETVHHTLEISEELPNLLPDAEKKLLAIEGRYQIAQEPSQLDTLYLLHRYHAEGGERREIAIETLGGREALVALLGHVSARPYLVPAEEALSLPILARVAAHVRVRVLRYPDGFEHQDAAYKRIIEDLEHT